jgi:hypothetical protein
VILVPRTMTILIQKGILILLLLLLLLLLITFTLGLYNYIVKQALFLGCVMLQPRWLQQTVQVMLLSMTNVLYFTLVHSGMSP